MFDSQSPEIHQLNFFIELYFLMKFHIHSYLIYVVILFRFIITEENDVQSTSISYIPLYRKYINPWENTQTKLLETI